MKHRNISWCLLSLFYFNACRHVESGLLWELNLAGLSRIRVESRTYTTNIATLQFKNESLSLNLLWDFYSLTCYVSIVEVASRSLACARAIPFDFARTTQLCALEFEEENENLVLRQGTSVLWESHSCGLCVESLRILDGYGMLKNLKGHANHMVVQSSNEGKSSPQLQEIISFPRRALQGTSNGSPSFSNQGSSSHGGHRNKKALAMEIVFPVAAFLLLALCLALAFTRRRKAKANQIYIGTGAHKSRRPNAEAVLQSLGPGLPPRFTYAEMQAATNGFEKKLGEGGYGAVYEGVLPASGDKIAVKVFLHTESTACRKGFCAEVMSIGEKKHSNLVQLRGFCVEEDYRMIVYELMENGSLNKVLFGGKAEKSKGQRLSWERRKAIAIDTATALAFLHEEGEQKTPVIHCDIKPENILLNENWEAKVSDFGLAKLLWASKAHHEKAEEDDAQEKAHHQDGNSNSKKQTPSAFASIDVSSRLSHLSRLTSSQGVRGTLGYLAPEWLHVVAGSNTITTASDVFSFGVVLLELIAGRRSMVPGHPFLPGHAFDMLADGRDLSSLLDPYLHATFLQGASLGNSASFEREDVQNIVNVALWCLQEDLNLRPTMVHVLDMLTSKEPVPLPPFCHYFVGSSHFFDENEYHHHNHRFSDFTSASQDKGLETSTNTSQDTSSWQISILSGR